MRKIEISNERVLETIRNYGFGAVIEITNGLSTQKGRETKKRQAIRGKQLLQEQIGDEAKIVSGLSLIKIANGIREIKELDFLIKLDNYEPRRLHRVVQSVITQNNLQTEDSTYLEEILDRADKGILYLPTALNPDKKMYKKLSKIDRQNYITKLAKIKGIVLENYVQSLFTSVLPKDSCEFYNELGFKNTETKKMRTSIDLVIATYSGLFYEALKEIKKNAKQPCKIHITHIGGQPKKEERDGIRPKTYKSKLLIPHYGTR